MKRRIFLALSGVATLVGCAGSGVPPQAELPPDGQPLPVIYRIDPDDELRIRFRVLDNVNSLRAVAGAQPLVLNAGLNAAAATHVRDMSLQNRPWHFGSDGSSPIDRARRVGYRGTVLGENISETYESELETIVAWMQQPDTRGVITDPAARDFGFAFFQEENGKVWWTMMTGDGAARAQNVPTPGVRANTGAVVVAP
ncbi:MAG: CAP domain-containing protein [Rhodobacteraceae bacterium]|nr:CAP domain-containing protein [Paracoccaceae bacterium]